MADEMAGAVIDAGAASEATEPIESEGAAEVSAEQGAETEGAERTVQPKTGAKTRASLETVYSAQKEALKAIDPSLP